MTSVGVEKVACEERTVLQESNEDDTVELRLARARLPFSRSLEEFDFGMQPVLRAQHLAFQLSHAFVAEGASLILTGKSGRGKTHLAVAIAQRAIEHGHDALFVGASRMVESIACQLGRGRGRGAWQRYLRPSLLVLEDIGFVVHNPNAASMLFQLVSERHRLGRSMVVTAHRAPEQWGDLLGHQDAGDAIVERLLERGVHVELAGPSMRAPQSSEADAEPNAEEVQLIRLSLLEQATPKAFEAGEALCKRVARELVGQIGLKEAIYHLRGMMNVEALERSSGSRRAAASLLGVDRRYVQRLAEEYTPDGCVGVDAEL